MKKSILLILLVSVTSSLMGQNALNTGAPGGMVEIRLLNGVQPREGASGSPYLETTFMPAIVDNFERQYMVRYNAEQGVMEFKNENNVTLVLSNEEEHTIKFQDGSRRVYKTMDLRGERVLLRVSWSDEKGNSLFVKEGVRFYPSEVAQTSYDTDKPDRYERQEDVFYFKNDSGLFIDLPQKKKKLTQLFGAKGAKQFFKKQKVNLKSEEGILKFVQGVLVS